MDLKVRADAELRVHLPDSELRCIPTTIDGFETAWMVVATIEVSAAELDVRDDRVQIPSEPRKILESHLEFVSGCISAGYQARAQVISVQPEVGFIPGSESDREFLARLHGIAREDTGSIWMRNSIDLRDLPFNELADRPIGIGLWSQSQSSGNAVSEFRDYLLILENGFASAANKDLGDTLLEFLRPTPFGYTREEIQRWIDNRPASMHADLRRTKFVAGEKDVRSFLHRMRQACLDVLFNKANWHDPSVDRRAIWQPKFYSTAPYEFSVTQAKADVVALAVDQFQAFRTCSLRLDADEYMIWTGNLESGTKLVSGPRVIVRSDDQPEPEAT
jgi:hypothetical protein